jgi:hypothetical protein
VEEEPLRHWELDADDRCPVCFVPPGARHLPGECIYSGPWSGSEDLPDEARPDVAAPDVAKRGDALADGDHDVSDADSGS